MDELELAREILRPHWDAVRDVYMSFVPPGESEPLSKVEDIYFDVDPKRHDSPRHFAACRDDGLRMVFAPQIVDLPVDTLIAILAHEFGHAVDFLYPAHWRMPDDGPACAEWIGNPTETKWGRHWLKKWHRRSKDQVEWGADGIAEAVTGKHLTYDGPLMLQCLHGGGIERPSGLR